MFTEEFLLGVLIICRTRSADSPRSGSFRETNCATTTRLARANYKASQQEREKGSARSFLFCQFPLAFARRRQEVTCLGNVSRGVLCTVEKEESSEVVGSTRTARVAIETRRSKKIAKSSEKDNAAMFFFREIVKVNEQEEKYFLSIVTRTH